MSPGSIAPNYFFLCNIEGDFLICAGLAQILKTRNPDAHTTALLPNHRRLKDKLTQYYSNFDNVVRLPYCWFSSNLVAGFKLCREFLWKLKSVPVPEGSILFMFDIFELTELLAYLEFAKLRKNRNLKIVSISAFDCGDAQPDKADLEIGKSFLYSLYSLWFSGTIFREYRTKDTNVGGIHFFPAVWDYQLCIEKSHALQSRSARIFFSLPYPATYIHTQSSQYQESLKSLLISAGCLILIDSQLPSYSSIPREVYWERVKALIDFLKNHYPLPIYVKNHPGFPEDAHNWLGDRKVNIIEKEISAEEIYLICRQNLKAVFGYASTALITASWFGIPSLDLSEYFGLAGKFLERCEEFLALGNNIRHISSLDDLRVQLPELRFSVSREDGTDTWITTLNEIEGSF